MSNAETPAKLPVLETVTVTKLADGFKFTEGTTADAQGNVFFTDQPNNRIHKWSVEGKLSTFLEPAARANGMCFAKDGKLITCADESTELRAVSMDGSHKVIVSGFEGRRLNGPNDVWVHPDGAFYFTDPFYKRPWWDYAERPQQIQGVYRVNADGTGLQLVAADLVKPNGITGTPDGKTLFVADIGAKKTYKYQIEPDGTLTGKTLFCEAGSDGMTIDTAGRLYLSGTGVMVFDPSGAQLGVIPVPEKWVGNLAFGGPKHDKLFICASLGFYCVELGTQGANPGK